MSVRARTLRVRREDQIAGRQLAAPHDALTNTPPHPSLIKISASLSLESS